MASGFPEGLSWSLARPINQWVEELVRNHGDFFNPFALLLSRMLYSIESLFLWMPWPLVLLLIGLLGYWSHRKLWFGLLMAGLFSLTGFLGLWYQTMQTLALMLTATFVTLSFGVPLGIAAAQWRGVYRVIIPLLDLMQTLPPFVYLVPVIFFFDLGAIPGLIATFVYAIPPSIRLTCLGIRLTPKDQQELGAALGANNVQQLWLIKLPNALPTIMSGVNQSIMLALSMVVVASMVGVSGLGQEVLIGVQRLDLGRGLIAGVCIAIIAIVIDRISSGFSRNNRSMD